MDRKEHACALHAAGANCAQAVLCSLAEKVGLDKVAAMRIATGFGGGMGRTGGTCGAVTGAYMALGMTAPDQKDVKEKTYALVRELGKRFAARNGTLVCKELLGCDLGTPDGLKEAQDRKLFSTRCMDLIRDAVEIAEGML